jgi:uncharacterized protein (TIGR03435 family)
MRLALYAVRSKRKWRITLKFLRIVLFCFSAMLAAFSSRVGLGQSADKSPEFEVASVRKAPSENIPYSESYPLDGKDGPPLRGTFRANASLQAYLLFAYKVNDSAQATTFWNTMPSQWHLQRYTIIANAEGEPTRDQVRIMMQSLLRARFGLVLDKETKIRSEYVFSLAGSSGSQLHKHPADVQCQTRPTPNSSIPSSRPDPEAPDYCGEARWYQDSKLHVRFVQQPMSAIVATLSSLAMADGNFEAHAAEDETGLQGAYDADIEFGPRYINGQPAPDVEGPSVHDAIRAQLGLKVVERKVPVGLLVITHVQEPSAN